jgi:acyl carrier protein
VEEVLVGIWEEVLGEEEVGIEDDFFELGGHSLRAMQLVSRVRSAFHVELPLRTLFDAATVVELATKIEAALGKALPSPPIRRVSRDEELPLSFAQERLWFLDQLEPGNYSYNMPVVIRLEGLLNAAALEQAMGEIVRRHEALRTNFSSKQGRPIQIIALPVAITIPVIDLEEFPEEEREACLIRLATEEARRPFNLSKDPLWRVTLIKMSEHNHALFFTVHHIVFDGWSTGVFIRELMALYEAFSSAAPSPLPELQIQYADFACWQRQWLQNDLLNTQLSYWERQFDGAPAILELPADRPRPSVQSFQGEVETLVVPETLTAQLRLLSRREGATLFMVLLAAFKTLLYHYTEREDIVVGTPIAGRNQEEVQGLIGLFVNTLVLRTDLSGDPTFIDLLGRVREVAIDAYTHQDLPFEMLVKKLRREGDLSHNPLFQVMFFLQNAPMPTPKLSNLALKPLILHNGTSMFDLTLFLVESEEKLIGVAEYSTDLFDRATIKIMLAKFLLLIERIIENPTSRISEIDLQLPIEKELNNLLQLELDL